MTEKEQAKLLQDTHDTVIEIRTILLGSEQNPGLCHRFHELEEDYVKFKRNVMVVMAFLVGSGAISIGVLQSL